MLNSSPTNSFRGFTRFSATKKDTCIWFKTRKTNEIFIKGWSRWLLLCVAGHWLCRTLGRKRPCVEGLTRATAQVQLWVPGPAGDVPRSLNQNTANTRALSRHTGRLYNLPGSHADSQAAARTWERMLTTSSTVCKNETQHTLHF